MAKQSREDGNNAFTTGNHELAITLYTEAMKYAQVHETLWEGETMAIAAANRYVLLGAQSFTLLKSDLHQDINGGFAFSRCLYGTFS